MLDLILTTQFAQITDALKARALVMEVYFVACGGSYALMMPLQYLMAREATGIAGFAVNAVEFTTQAPRRLGATSVVVLCSHSGTTPETVEAARMARAAGALTIALTHVPGSPLDSGADHNLHYHHAPLAMSAQHSAALLFRLGFGILAAREGHSGLAALDQALDSIGPIAARAAADHADRALAFAEAHKREPVIYTMGTGASHGVAYSYAICILQEMLWVHSAAIHAGEYFHGPLEITDFDTPLIILLGLGDSRAMDTRALAFAARYSKKVTVIDAQDFAFDGIATEIAVYLAPLVFAPVLRAYAERLADSKGHPLTTRRYMWKMAY